MDPDLRTEPQKERDLEDLLDSIMSGSIADADELNELDVELLRRHFGEGEEIDSLFDRLRAPKRMD